MSSYENYSSTASNYDKTRRPGGWEIILGCFSGAPVPLHQMTVLDAGCGTGNFAEKVIAHVARIEAVDLNPEMITQARKKLANEQKANKIKFHVDPLDTLPFGDAHFDGIMINQVLHHLPEEAGGEFSFHRRVFEELARVAKPGGVLVVNTCSTQQLAESYWYYDLIPHAARELAARFAPLDRLTAILTECGFRVHGRIVPLDEIPQGVDYSDPTGPSKKEWRDGDSIWALVEPSELEQAVARVQAMNENGEFERLLAKHEAKRKTIGQLTFIHCSRE